MSTDPSDAIKHIRERPRMYVGSLGFFGVIHYLVDVTSLYLQHKPTRLTVSTKGRGFMFTSDVSLPITVNRAGQVFPFEFFEQDGSRIIFNNGPVVCALSKEFSYVERASPGSQSFGYFCGKRDDTRCIDCPMEAVSCICCFPDETVFEDTAISPYNLMSYLRRLSYLHPGVTFEFVDAGERHVFCSQDGILELFLATAAPYQLLHQPIIFSTHIDDLSLEFAFAFQSWSDDYLLGFVNNGRAVEGGTHQSGLERAVKHVREEIFEKNNGVVGLLSIHYPEVQWQGCIKGSIANPELESLVHDAIVKHVENWCNNHPDLRRQIEMIQTFQFPHAW